MLAVSKIDERPKLWVCVDQSPPQPTNVGSAEKASFIVDTEGKYGHESIIIQEMNRMMGVEVRELHDSETRGGESQH